MSRATSEQNKAGFRWVVFILMIFAAIDVSGRNGAFIGSLTDPVKILINSDKKTATITRCVEDDVSTRTRKGRNRATNKGGVKEKALYTTQAITSDGASARGSYFFGWNGAEWCESKIGDEVKVRIHKTDPSLNRISTFTGLWYPPFQILLALFWVIIASRIKPLAWAVLGFNIIVIPILFNMA